MKDSYLGYEDHDSLEDLLFEPERRLLVAILERAIADALFATGKCAEALMHARDGYAWIISENNTQGSFIWVCNALDFDADKLREYVTSSKKNHKNFLRLKNRTSPKP